MSQTQESPPMFVPEPLEFSAEDWFVLDDVLNRVARALRKLENEQQHKSLKEAKDQMSQTR